MQNNKKNFYKLKMNLNSRNLINRCKGKKIGLKNYKQQLYKNSFKILYLFKKQSSFNKLSKMLKSFYKH